jgi:hypothetical protein
VEPTSTGTSPGQLTWEQAREIVRDPTIRHTSDELLRYLLIHVQQCSTHGVGCICMDDFARAYRRMLGLRIASVADYGQDSRGYNAWKDLPDTQVQRRLRHILSMVSRTDML